MEKIVLPGSHTLQQDRLTYSNNFSINVDCEKSTSFKSIIPKVSLHHLLLHSQYHWYKYTKLFIKVTCVSSLPLLLFITSINQLNFFPSTLCHAYWMLSMAQPHVISIRVKRSHISNCSFYSYKVWCCSRHGHG